MTHTYLGVKSAKHKPGCVAPTYMVSDTSPYCGQAAKRARGDTRINNRWLSILGLVLCSSACKDEVWTQPNLDHCTWNGGDSYCADRFPEKPYCIVGEGECAMGDRYGCVVEVAPECHAPCGEPEDLSCVDGTSSNGTSSNGTSSESGVGGRESATGADSTGTTTGPSPCTSTDECTHPDALFCVTGECLGCQAVDVVELEQDAACATLDPARPRCVDGSCVACEGQASDVCELQGLVCDEQAHECVPCTDHSQCETGACDIDTGTCFPTSSVLHVDKDQGYYSSFSLAMLAISNMGLDRAVLVVHEPDDGTWFNDTLLVDQALTLAIIAAEGENPVLRGVGGAPTIQVQGPAARLYLLGMTLASNYSADAVVVAGSSTWIDRTSILNNAGGVGLRIDAGLAWVDRSRVVGNNGGGVLVENGAELTLRNSFVGQAVNNIDALTIDGARATVVYSTLVGAFNAAALVCVAPMMVDVRNSILVTEGGTAPDELDCAPATVTHSTTEGTATGTGNVAVGAFPERNGRRLVHQLHSGRLRPQNDGLTVFADVAQWTTGDPLTDIDGDPRPALDGTPDYAGADVP